MKGRDLVVFGKPFGRGDKRVAAGFQQQHGAIRLCEPGRKRAPARARADDDIFLCARWGGGLAHLYLSLPVGME